MTLSAHDAGQVHAWAAALRSGEAVTWAEFRGRGERADSDGPVPGTAQLELLRRLAAHPGLPRFSDLGDLVLGSTGPGRGLVDPPLPGLSTGSFGVAPAEPDLLPGNEIIRAASGVLVPLLLRSRTRVPRQRKRLRLPGRRRFTVHGSPLSAAAVRRALIEAGWAEGGRDAVRLVVGRDLETMMAELWHARVAGGAERRWRPLWRRASTIDALPPRLRLDEIAATGDAHLLLAGDAAGLSAALADAVGVRAVLEPQRPDPIATDLLRRLNPFLVMNGGRAGRDRAVAGAWQAALAGSEPITIGAPPGLRPWAHQAAERLVEAVRAGDYAVHGDPAVLVPDRSRVTARAVDPDRVADLAVRVIATLWLVENREGAR